MANINNISNGNEQDVKKRLEWLVDKLMAAEEARDNALDKLEEVQLENLSLRGRLHTIGLILDDTTLMPDNEKENINFNEQIFGNSEDLF